MWAKNHHHREHRVHRGKQREISVFSVRSAVSHRRAAGVRGTNGVVKRCIYPISHSLLLFLAAQSPQAGKARITSRMTR